MEKAVQTFSKTVELEAKENESAVEAAQKVVQNYKQNGKRIKEIITNEYR